MQQHSAAMWSKYEVHNKKYPTGVGVGVWAVLCRKSGKKESTP
jgi:hypothetical protein